jgi:hypothetical protein
VVVRKAPVEDAHPGVKTVLHFLKMAFTGGPALSLASAREAFYPIEKTTAYM